MMLWYSCLFFLGEIIPISRDSVFFWFGDSALGNWYSFKMTKISNYVFEVAQFY